MRKTTQADHPAVTAISRAFWVFVLRIMGLPGRSNFLILLVFDMTAFRRQGASCGRENGSAASRCMAGCHFKALIGNGEHLQANWKGE